MLSCAIVDNLRRTQQGLVGFAFLTYENESISALSIMHSLIFQLVGKDDELMSVVCESTCEDLKHDLAVAIELLISLIRHAGSFHLVVDGLDEISSVERERLVTGLLEVAEVCEGLRVVLSSRPEADLVRILDHTAIHIQVHEHNEGSISAYVTQRSQQMFNGLAVPKSGQIEIIKLLAPVANRAKGMFLYARLTMDMVAKMHDLSEIQDELAVLPESLDDA